MADPDMIANLMQEFVNSNPTASYELLVMMVQHYMILRYDRSNLSGLVYEKLIETIRDEEDVSSSIVGVTSNSRKYHQELFRLKYKDAVFKVTSQKTTMEKANQTTYNVIDLFFVERK